MSRPIMFRNYFKPISISLSPNVEKDDVKLAEYLINRPRLWKNGKSIKALEEFFREYLGVKYAVSFNSGRSSLYAILRALGLEKGSKVFLQAFTCNAVPNPILWAGLEPVYIDCNRKNFNIDLEDLKNKIAENPDAKILIVQHTFGLPANMDEITAIAKENNLILIEDCAHALGAEWKGKLLGTFDKAAFFSFSRDKVISSVYGGMAVTNDDELGKNLEQLQKQFGKPGNLWIMQQILHPILLDSVILPIYNLLDLGKIFLVLSQAFHILSKAVSWQEKKGKKPGYFPKAFPNALAIMAFNQLNKLEKFYSHRKEISDYYRENLKGSLFTLPSEDENSKQSYLRFTVKHKDAHEIIYEAWHKQNILIGDWYTTCIAPFDTKLDEMKYKPGMCPNAEHLARQTINLPTHINISQKDAERIVKFLKQWK